MTLLWSISFLVVLIFLSNFLTNYLKSLDIENDHNSPDAFWKFTYDHYDKNEFNKSVIKVKDSDLVEKQKIFKDRLIILYWLLTISIFVTIIYILTLVLKMILL
ncbi:hypothetical protein N9481_02405 [Pelagibacteraceae bacterium]|nr:hypothetical protein [Pelagibacteraceae bacterium]